MGGGAALGISADGLEAFTEFCGGKGGTSLGALVGARGGAVRTGTSVEDGLPRLSSVSVLSSSKLESRPCDFNASLCFALDAMSVS